MMTTRSNSQLNGMSAVKRAAFLVDIARMHFKRLMSKGGFTHMGENLQAYLDLYAARTGKDLKGAAIMELGYGQRPFRMIVLQSLGHNVIGIDLDASLYKMTPGRIAALVSANGPLRAAKSIGRRILFDGSDYRKLDAYLRSTFGKPLCFDDSSLLTGDLGDPEVWKRAGRKFDFIYSEDVFEHIPPDSLARVIDNMAENLALGGLAVITPMIYTGISGAHDVEWFPHRVDRTDIKRGLPWAHLTGDAFNEADTYLNKLTRKDYRTLFARRFDILGETEMLGRLGADHLTDDRRAQLSAYDDDELFSNNVRFVLSARAEGAGNA